MKIIYSDKAKRLTPAAAVDGGAPRGNVPAPTTYSANDIVAVEAKVAMPNDAGLNDIVVGFLLPAQHVPVDLFIGTDDLDGGAALTLSVGVLTDDFSALVANTNFITNSTVGQAGGIARASVVDGLRLAPSDKDRWIGAKITAAANPAVAGTLTFNAQYRAANGD